MFSKCFVHGSLYQFKPALEGSEPPMYETIQKGARWCCFFHFSSPQASLRRAVPPPDAHFVAFGMGKVVA